MHKSLIAASALLLVGVTASAAAPKAKVAAKKAAPIVCAVTGETIPSVKDAAGSSTYKGKTYYFCCASCKPTFDKDPAKYAKTDAKPSHKM